MAAPRVLNNLIDLSLSMEADPAMQGRADLMFTRILLDYFFHHEVNQSRSIEQLVRDMILPDFIREAPSLIDIDREKFSAFVQGETLNDSLAGRIMLSGTYLKIFFPHHPPLFNKLSESEKQELVNSIKSRNDCILQSFAKMISDMEADKKRNVLSLVALVLMNTHKRTGKNLRDLPGSAEDIIRKYFREPDEIFRGTRSQMADLMSEGLVRDLIKNFFVVRQFSDMAEIADIFGKEIERYRKRAAKSFR